MNAEQCYKTRSEEIMSEYEKPEFIEVRMDAEIGAYQADPLDPPFVEEETPARED